MDLGCEPLLTALEIKVNFYSANTCPTYGAIPRCQELSDSRICVSTKFPPWRLWQCSGNNSMGLSNSRDLSLLPHTSSSLTWASTHLMLKTASRGGRPLKHFGSTLWGIYLPLSQFEVGSLPCHRWPSPCPLGRLCNRPLRLLQTLKNQTGWISLQCNTSSWPGIVFPLKHKSNQFLDVP